MINIDVRSFILRAAAVLIAMVVHEWAHAFSAYRLGDDTAKINGRMSFNPFRHVDPIGIILLMMLGFGWARPVEINQSRLRHGKLGIICVSMAGIIANLVLFFIANALLVLNLKSIYTLAAINEVGAFKLADIFRGFGYYPMRMQELRPEIIYHQFLISLVMVNMGMAFFNLLPIPPLDGSHVVDQLFFRGRLYKHLDRAKIGLLMLGVFLLARFTDVISNYMHFCMEHAQALALRIMGV